MFATARRNPSNVIWECRRQYVIFSFNITGNKDFFRKRADLVYLQACAVYFK